MPTLLSGTYNLSVHTDYRNQVFELYSDDNNINSMVFTIQRRSPDLIISNYTYSIEQTIRGNLLRFNYTVENAGSGTTIGAPWIDRLRITPLAVGNNAGMTLREARRSGELPVGHDYSETLVMLLPPRLFGAMHLRLLIDARGQIVEDNKMNNMLVTPTVNIQPLFPDLAVQNLTIVGGSSIVGGQAIDIEWSGINRGEAIVEPSRWYDSIFLNSTQALDKLADVVVSNGNMLQPNMTYHSRTTVTLPFLLDYSLAYSLLLQINSRGHFDENRRSSNNVRGLTLAISPPPSPDLQVTGLSFAYFPSSRVLTAQWTVRNVGNSMMSVMTWRDQILLSSPQTFFNPAGAIILSTVEQSLRLQVDQVYTLRDSSTIPSTLSGDFYVYIVTDISGSIMEIDGEENNIFQSNTTLSIAPVPTATLNVNLNTGILPSSFFTGQMFSLEYSVMNGGDVALSATSWVDAVYLSTIANPSRSYLLGDGFLLTQTLNSMQVDQNGTYSVTVNITLPHQITGQQYLSVLIDMNNALDIQTVGTYGTIINIEEGALPDLAVSTISRDPNITSGQPATIDYTVRNDGDASATGRWYEALILSQDAEIDPFDTRLVTVSNPTQALRGNESYNQSVEVFIPYDLPTSFYYIFIIVDSRNDVYEQQEDNNINHSVVFITETISTDISVLGVEVTPSRVNYREILTFRWRLRNNGSLQASGYKCDSIYLSRDTSWDLSDFELDIPQCGPVTLNAFSNNFNNDRLHSHRAITPFVAQQEYYGLVRTRTNIRDPNLTNNVGVSAYLVEVNAPTITLGRLTRISLEPGEVQVFRILEVPSDETLVAILTTEQRNIYHDLFLRNRQAPTGAEHDAFSQFSLSSNQQAVVRHTRSGDYYLRVESFTTSRMNSRYNVDVLVKIAQFEIHNISPVRAAPLGNVTIKITGTVISYYSSASLISVSSNVEYQSSKVFWFTSESVYATFNLAGASIGHYSVRLTDQKTGRSAQLNNSFVIANGVFGRLVIEVQSPGRLRPGDTGDIIVQLQNIGNTDILTPHLVITSRDRTHFRLLDDYAPNDFRRQIDFLGLPLEGPGGILPPGTSTQVVFRAAQMVLGANRARYSIKREMNDSAPHAFVDKKSNLRPRFIYSDEVWDIVWDNFIKSVGTTQQSFQQRLSEIATELSLVGKRAHFVKDLVKYQLQVAYGILSGILIII